MGKAESGERTFKVLVFGWRICVQLFYILVTLYVFSRLDTKQESLMVALFGLIYVTVRNVAIGNVMLMQGLARGLQNEIDAIKAAIIPGFEIDYEARKDAVEQIKDGKTKLWFDVGGLTIIGLICLITVFDAI